MTQQAKLLALGPIFKSPCWQLVFDRAKKWLPRRFSSSQRIETNEARVQVDFSSDQTMRPVFIHRKAVPQKANLSLLVSPAQENNVAARARLEVQLPAIGKRLSCWSLLDASSESVAIGSHVPSRLCLYRRQRVIMEALPDFSLPAGIVTFDCRLKAGFLDRGEHGDNFQAQTKSHDTADRVPKLMSPLETGVVIKLSVSRKPKDAPMLGEGFYSTSGRNGGIRPRGDQSTVERDSIKDFDVNAAFNHQALDNVEAVEFTSPLCHFRQIPAGRWWPMTKTTATIQSSPTFQNAANGANGGNTDNTPVEQLPTDRQSAILAQGAGCFKFMANRQHQLLHGRTRTLNLVRDRRPISPVHFIEGRIASAFKPSFNRSESDPIKPRGFAHRSPLANGQNQRLSSVRQRTFLIIFKLQQRFCSTLDNAISIAKCSGGCGTYAFRTLWYLPGKF